MFPPQSFRSCTSSKPKFEPSWPHPVPHNYDLTTSTSACGLPKLRPFVKKAGLMFFLLWCFGIPRILDSRSLWITDHITIYMYIYIYIFIYIYIIIYIYIYTHTYVYIIIYIYIRVCAYVYTYSHMPCNCHVWFCRGQMLKSVGSSPSTVWKSPGSLFDRLIDNPKWLWDQWLGWS